MIDDRDPAALELMAAYLGVNAEEIASELRRGVTLDVFADRYGRPRIGLEELVEQTLGRAAARR